MKRSVCIAPFHSPTSAIPSIADAWKRHITATSPTIRQVLNSHPNLPGLLTSIDNLRGPDRDFALQRALGVTANDLTDLSGPTELTDDVLALRALAEAVEGAVRGDNRGALGLDWGE